MVAHAQAVHTRPSFCSHAAWERGYACTSAKLLVKTMWWKNGYVRVC